MRVIVRARIGRVAQSREARLKRLLTRASEAGWYAPWPSPEESTPDAILAALPVVSVSTFESSLARMADSSTGTPFEQDLHYPLDPAPRIAVVAEGFRSTKSVRTFVECDLSEIAGWRVQTLAAPIDTLRALALLGRRLDYPVIAFTGFRHGELTEEDRHIFWSSFQVPVFEQVVGVHGEVIAEECEAHEGLHVRDEHAMAECIDGEFVYSSLVNIHRPAVRIGTGFSGTLTDTCCGCGRAGLRLESFARKTARDSGTFVAQC